MYKDVFLKIITEDLKSDIMSPSPFVKTRQQKGTTGGGRVHQNLLPDMHKADPTENKRIRELLDRPSGRLMLSPQELEYIKSKYNISDLTPNNPRKLGNTGVTIMFDKMLNNYTLIK